MTLGAWILVASLLLALAVAGWRAWTDGRFRGTHRVHGVEVGEAAAATESEDGATHPEVEVRVSRPEVEVRAQRATKPGDAQLVLPADQLGERATLLQFSSAFCAPCRATRRVLAEVAESVPGVAHVEIDAEHHLELVRRVGVLRTPTTLVLDAQGHEVTRASGAPRREQVLTALAHVVV